MTSTGFDIEDVNVVLFNPEIDASDKLVQIFIVGQDAKQPLALTSGNEIVERQSLEVLLPYPTVHGGGIVSDIPDYAQLSSEAWRHDSVVLVRL